MGIIPKVQLIGCLMLIDVQSALGTNLRELGAGPKIQNKDKSDYYSKLFSDNSHDSRKLWHELHKTLDRVSDATLPSHESERSLAHQFASCFLNKIKKIRDTFIPSGTKNEVHPPSNPPKITVFSQVSEDGIGKIIKTSPTKSCLLDPWLTFRPNKCIDILLPSLTKLVNCSWRDVSLMLSKLL